LKPALDVLQKNPDQQKTVAGIDLIEDDKLVYEINAMNEIVLEKSEDGIEIDIFPYAVTPFRQHITTDSRGN